MYADTVIDVMHVPLEHVLPPGHTLPHAPQWLVLLAVLTHWFEQSVRPGLQIFLHTPAVQS